MLSIGAFAQVGQVTHRMLRHWDRSGLLVPAHVDEFSGYRSYDPEQFWQLHRIVALRQLGFGLDDITVILADGVDTDRLAELLQARRAEVEREHTTAAAQLVDVERRLRLIEKEDHMSSIEIVEKPLPAVRIAARTAVVAGQAAVAATVGPMFAEVAKALGLLPGTPATPVAQYTTDEDGLRIVAGYVYDGAMVPGVEVVDLPAVPTAVCGVHLGAMDRIGTSWQSLHTEAMARGLTPSGPNREVYLRAEPGLDQSSWVTELQQPVSRA